MELGKGSGGAAASRDRFMQPAAQGTHRGGSGATPDDAINIDGSPPAKGERRILYAHAAL